MGGTYGAAIDGYNQQQNLDAFSVYTGAKEQELNYAWVTVGEYLRGPRETPQERAHRLVAEAKQRHPEWQVKRLAVPLE